MHVFLAHGTLGEWDELIFLGVVVVFIVLMGISWVVSRMNTPEIDDDDDSQPEEERFKLD